MEGIWTRFLAIWSQCSTTWANTPTLNWETFFIGNTSGTDGIEKKASVAFPTFNYSGLISLRPNEPNYRIKLPTHFIQTQLFYNITLNQNTRMWTNCRWVNQGLYVRMPITDLRTALSCPVSPSLTSFFINLLWFSLWWRY